MEVTFLLHYCISLSFKNNKCSTTAVLNSNIRTLISATATSKSVTVTSRGGNFINTIHSSNIKFIHWLSFASAWTTLFFNRIEEHKFHWYKLPKNYGCFPKSVFREGILAWRRSHVAYVSTSTFSIKLHNFSYMIGEGKTILAPGETAIAFIPQCRLWKSPLLPQIFYQWRPIWVKAVWLPPCIYIPQATLYIHSLIMWILSMHFSLTGRQLLWSMFYHFVSTLYHYDRFSIETLCEMIERHSLHVVKYHSVFILLISAIGILTCRHIMYT